MSQPHYSLSWDKYQSNVCSHFSKLQQKGEFVDLTLAADGHLVKVHQLLLGIASPYIRELLQSAPCKHPVIFLNNISYSTLASILQYVYTGEVAISGAELTSFFEACRALQIQGIDSSDLGTTDAEPQDVEEVRLDPQTGLQTVVGKQQVEEAVVAEEGVPEAVYVPLAARNVRITTSPPVTGDEDTASQHSSTQAKLISSATFEMIDHAEAEGSSQQSAELEMEVMEEAELKAQGMEECTGEEGGGDVGSVEYFTLAPIVEDSTAAYPNMKEVQYTVSNRGSLQLILNRFVYNLFSKSKGGVVRRWRCVDYRNQKCPACTVTNGNVVVRRTSMHNHPYHDKKIMGKIKKKAVYSAIKLATNEAESKS